jgi:hypothetical protein
MAGEDGRTVEHAEHVHLDVAAERRRVGLRQRADRFEDARVVDPEVDAT